jgi:hypothetical protein
LRDAPKRLPLIEHVATRLRSRPFEGGIAEPQPGGAIPKSAMPISEIRIRYIMEYLYL